MQFSDKVRKAERIWVEGGIYVCTVCDGKCQHCDDDYQCSECEKTEILEYEENIIKESFRMKKNGKQNKHLLIFNEGV